MPSVSIYDSTLRDGAQMAGVNFSRQDKYLIVKNLIEQLGIGFIEVYPSSNPKDRELIKDIEVKNPEYLAHLAAFGSTRHVKKTVENDPNLTEIIKSGLKHASIFGKSWDFHLDFIHATPVENLQMIEESIAFLCKNEITVFFDAEHFFDGYKANPEYAIKTLKAAERGGALLLVLCDTNGGTLPHEIVQITEEVIKITELPLGIHAHNDSGLGVANSLEAVRVCIKHNRFCQVQGTLNGIGERTGNANLTTIIPILILKMNMTGILPLRKLENLQSVSNLIYELSNIVPPLNSPFVGVNAFSHKGGMHIAAMKKAKKSYEHIDPISVGNKRQVIISEMSGRSAIIDKCKHFGLCFEKEDPILETILKVIKRKESNGYTYEGADASLEILIKGMIVDPKLESAYYRSYFFEVDYFRVVVDARNLFHEDNLTIYTDASLKTLVAHKDGFHDYHTAADGNGPVNALDKALRKALIHFYPVLKEIELIDYKVRITNAEDIENGTASRVRVLVETKDFDGQIWGTIGSHVNIIVASFVALLDSYVYKLMKENVLPFSK